MQNIMLGKTMSKWYLHHPATNGTTTAQSAMNSMKNDLTAGSKASTVASSACSSTGRHVEALPFRPLIFDLVEEDLWTSDL